MSSNPEVSASPRPSPASRDCRMSVVPYDVATPAGRSPLRRRRPVYRMRIDYPALQVTLADPRLRRSDDELQYRFVQTDHLLRELDERVCNLSSRSRIRGGVIVTFTVRLRHHSSPEQLAQKIEALVV